MKHQKQQNFIQGPRHQRDGGGWGWGGWGMAHHFFGYQQEKRKTKKK